jgi:hypothetical protein
MTANGQADLLTVCRLRVDLRLSDRVELNVRNVQQIFGMVLTYYDIDLLCRCRYSYYSLQHIRPTPGN